MLSVSVCPFISANGERSTSIPLILLTTEVTALPSGILNVTLVVDPGVKPDTVYPRVPVRSKKSEESPPATVGVDVTSDNTVLVSEST